MDKTTLVLVRRSPRHSVIAHCRVVDWTPQYGRHALRLLRVSPDHGLVPPGVEGLYDQVFSTRRKLREAILQKMKENKDGN